MIRDEGTPHGRPWEVCSQVHSRGLESHVRCTISWLESACDVANEVLVQVVTELHSYCVWMIAPFMDGHSFHLDELLAHTTL